jgi:hypothetical protein
MIAGLRRVFCGEMAVESIKLGMVPSAARIRALMASGPDGVEGAGHGAWVMPSAAG